MRLTSSAFESKGRIPARYTCDGVNISPPLVWTDPPDETRTFALVCTDPDASGGVWHHWAIYDIPAATRALAEHWPPTRKDPPQAINDFHRAGYGGPCPLRGDAPHCYRFRLYALSVRSLRPCTHCRDVDTAARSHAIATAELIGRYQRI
jgi:Raf kinase inhibitor-like YbhB/YbcL family protein